jgi:phosphoribosylaminoimidazole-succinocarboxamide synthase
LKALKETNFGFPGQTGFYKGKVRDVYYFNEKILVVATDRISAFDHILPQAIPCKGQILNGIAAYFLEASKAIVPNWLEASPHPNISYGKFAEPIKLEMVVRGYLAGHAWREYNAGRRMLCGVTMPEGMKESDKFESPIITPATKADEGHDEDISKEEILEQGIVTEAVWNKLSDYALALFELGSQMAMEKGLILVDTKYEFGIYNDEIILIDEVHTPDSSRYYMLEGYDERQEKGVKQKQLSKEFVREWLMTHGFQGKEGQSMPDMPDQFVETVTVRYIELYEKITGQAFEKNTYDGIEDSIETAVLNILSHES